MIVEQRVDAVFIPVGDMARAIAWYSTLLALPPVPATHEGLIYGLPLPGETGIMLDGHAHARGEVIDRRVPLILFNAHSIEEVVAFAQSHDTPVTEPEDIGSVTVVYLDDPDGNQICIKVSNDPQETGSPA